MLDKELLEILACPHCKSNLEFESGFLVSECGLKFKVEDDIPVMLLEEAILPEGVESIEQLQMGKSN